MLVTEAELKLGNSASAPAAPPPSALSPTAPLAKNAAAKNESKAAGGGAVAKLDDSRAGDLEVGGSATEDEASSVSVLWRKRVMVLGFVVMILLLAAGTAIGLIFVLRNSNTDGDDSSGGERRMLAALETFAPRVRTLLLRRLQCAFDLAGAASS